MGSDSELIANTEQHLEPGETALASVLGKGQRQIMNDYDRKALLVATDQRVLVNVDLGWMFGYKLESIPYSNISSIERSKGLRGHKIKISRSSGSQGSKINISSPDAEITIKYIKETGGLDLLVREVNSRLQ